MPRRIVNGAVTMYRGNVMRKQCASVFLKSDKDHKLLMRNILPENSHVTIGVHPINLEIIEK